jgi:hypothetical protein
VTCSSFKGPCHEIFDLWFFSSNNSIWAPDIRVTAYWNTWLCICGDFWFWNRLFHWSQWHRWPQKWSLANPHIFSLNFKNIVLPMYDFFYFISSQRMITLRPPGQQIHIWSAVSLTGQEELWYWSAVPITPLTTCQLCKAVSPGKNFYAAAAPSPILL